MPMRAQEDAVDDLAAKREAKVLQGEELLRQQGLLNGEGLSDHDSLSSGGVLPTVQVPQMQAPKGLELWQDEIPGGVNYDGKVVEWEGRGNVRVRTDTGMQLWAQRAKFRVSVESEGGDSEVRFLGGVKMEDKSGLQVFADEAHLRHLHKEVSLMGDVSVYSGNSLTKAEEVTYNYEKEELVSKALKVSFDPFLLDTQEFRREMREGREVYVAENAGVTTHDVEQPSYWMRGGEVTVYPEDKVVFRDLRMEFGGRTYFWFPYYVHSLDEDLGYRFEPGARSNWGVFLKNRYGMVVGGGDDPDDWLGGDDPWLVAQWRMDYYMLRGLGLGVNLLDRNQKQNPNLGWLKLYHIYDQDPSEQRANTTESRDGVPTSRYKLQLRERLDWDVLPGAQGYWDADFTYVSDRFYLEDFEPGNFAIEPEPDNTLMLTQRWDYSDLSAWARFRPNDFYQTDTRLPEVALEQVRRPLGESGFLHEGVVSAGIYQEDLADYEDNALRQEFQNAATTTQRRSEISEQLDGRGHTRLHAWQEVSRPFNIDGKVNLTARAGGGYTAYDNVRGDANHEERLMHYVGFDASMKWSKDMPDVVSRKWGIDGLLHIIQPYVSGSYLAVNDISSELRPIERLTASTRPRPLHPGRYTAIDDFRDWSVLRLGLLNKFLTKRDEGTLNWLTTNTYLDIYGDDGEFDRTLSNLYSDIEWAPLPWMAMSMETQFPLSDEEGGFSELSTAISWLPTDDLSFRFTQRWLNNHPFLTDSNRIGLETYYRVNEIFGLGMQHQWELDSNTLEFQRYAIHWRANSWAFSLGVFHRDNPSKDEYGVLTSFSLLDFPKFAVPVSIDGS